MMTNEYRFKCYMDECSFKKKPSSQEVKGISSRILDCLREFTIPEFAEELGSNGKTTVLAEYVRGEKLSKTSKLMKQNILMLDFDNNGKEQLSISELLEIPFIQENASFFYETFSSDSLKNKFRVVFVLEMGLTNYKQVESAYQKLYELFPSADTKVGQTNRMFFGGTKGYVEINFDNRLDFLKLVSENSIQESPSHMILDSNTKNYMLFKTRSYDILAKKFGNKYQGVFPDESSVNAFFRQVDMREFLELPRENPFLDILHEEENPSASVYLSENTGIYLYKVFSESREKVMSLVDLVMHLTGETLLDTLEVLIKVTNSKLDYYSESAVIQRQTSLFIDQIRSEDFKVTHSEINKWTSRYVSEISAVLKIISSNLWQDFETNEIKAICFLSNETMAKEVTTLLGREVTPRKIRTVIDVLSLLETVYKLNDSEIPRNLLRDLNTQKMRKKHQRRVNVLEMREFQDNYLEEMTNVAMELNKNNVTIKGLSFELLFRLFDEDKAKSVFPQTKTPDGEYTVSKESSDIEKFITKYMFDEISNRNFVYEQDIFLKLCEHFSKSKADYSLKKMRRDIANKYGFERSRLNKQLCVKFNIENPKYGKILYFQSE